MLISLHFWLSLAVNFQMSRSIEDNKPNTPDMTLHQVSITLLTLPLSGRQLNLNKMIYTSEKTTYVAIRR